MHPKDADKMAKSVEPDQTAPLGAVWSGSALFAQSYLSQNLNFYDTRNLNVCYFQVHYLFGGNPGKESLPRMRLDDFWCLQVNYDLFWFVSL